MSKKTVTAVTSLRINTNIYRPGEAVKPADLARLPAEERDSLFEQGKLKGGSEPVQDEPDPSTGEDGPYTKEFLMGQNKAFTRDLLEAAGADQGEWSDLNKEPLIDFYLDFVS